MGDPKKILFVASEVFPLAKTGGLADVSGSLPLALGELGVTVQVLLPAYPGVSEKTHGMKIVCEFVEETSGFSAQLLSGEIALNGQKVWLLDIPELFDRDGGLYSDNNQQDWPDNPLRFAALSRVACQLAVGELVPGWKADLVHCNDWQTGLIPAYLSLIDLPRSEKPATLFTIHNLAYQGVFSRDQFDFLKMPEDWWQPDCLEYYGNFSFLKAGLVFSDWINTVSPSYSNEILEPETGMGMEGLLQYRQNCLSGILNGADYDVWDPDHDPLIKFPYSTQDLTGKQHNKSALQRQMSLTMSRDSMLVGMVSRLVGQKGFDLIIPLIEAVMDEQSQPSTQQSPQDRKEPLVQWVLLGTGEPEYQQSIIELNRRFPNQVAIHLGYDETLAHRIEAGCDLFLMPSRYEPCGLNQMYSLRYGALPLVHATGGLGDSVVDSNAKTIADGTATGFSFADYKLENLRETFKRAREMYRAPETWGKVQQNAMKQDFSWAQSAKQYLMLYKQLGI
ncbi:MAG: glycogen synthase GlgA [Pseudomonadales bacterium]|nr:glycogen synthase GlgA [Pseudomonadales bacterium]